MFQVQLAVTILYDKAIKSSGVVAQVVSLSKGVYEQELEHMLQYINKLIELKRDEKGVTALEYGLIAALIAVVIITAVTSLGSNLSTTFNNVANKLGTNGLGTSNAPASK